MKWDIKDFQAYAEYVLVELTSESGHTAMMVLTPEEYNDFKQKLGDEPLTQDDQREIKYKFLGGNSVTRVLTLIGADGVTRKFNIRISDEKGVIDCNKIEGK